MQLASGGPPLRPADQGALLPDAAPASVRAGGWPDTFGSRPVQEQRRDFPRVLVERLRRLFSSTGGWLANFEGSEACVRV